MCACAPVWPQVTYMSADRAHRQCSAREPARLKIKTRPTQAIARVQVLRLLRKLRWLQWLLLRMSLQLLPSELGCFSPAADGLTLGLCTDTAKAG